MRVVLLIVFLLVCCKGSPEPVPVPQVPSELNDALVAALSEIFSSIPENELIGIVMADNQVSPTGPPRFGLRSLGLTIRVTTWHLDPDTGLPVEKVYPIEDGK